MSVNMDKAVYFPAMHRSLVRREVPGWVRFLEPGLEKVVSEGNFQPTGLPLPPAQARSFLGESIRFGEQFKKPEEMRFFGVVPFEDFYSQTSMAIRSRLANVEAPEDPSHDLLRAQKTLLLQWFYEERQMEMHSLEKDIDHSMNSVESILGIDAEHEDLLEIAEGDSAEECPEIIEAGTALIEAFLTVVPDDVPLFTLDSGLLERLRDMGALFAQDATDTLLRAKITGAVLVGGRIGKEKPWHGKIYSILTLQS
jgi:hypothetical protein